MNQSRPWLVLVLALFCLPLFVDLGRLDVGTDEAIYSFAVDRILETGNWIEPKSIPNEDWAFLEKPPLKFWIVAAPIAAGILPHDEFGIRFWDAAFGGLAFVYVFAIGCLLAGPVCGAVAALILFSHWPLVFDHGLRSNNMESALLLSYCGGIYHLLRWGRTPDLLVRRSLSEGGKVGPTYHSRQDRQPYVGPTFRSGAYRHATAFALYFVLGFMTKFVAAIFLPFVAALAVLVVRDYRSRFQRDWRIWTWCAGLTLALCAPWFIWAHLKYGAFFWQTILSEAVYRRFTTFLNPVHVQPWYYYFVTMWERFGDSGINYLLLAGIVVLTIQTIRRRWSEGFVVLLWLLVPMLLISLGTSKLYHYAYPFLPPAALAAGYLAALVLMLAPVPLARALEGAYDAAVSRVPALLAIFKRPRFRSAMMLIAAAAVVVGLVSLIYGPIRLTVGRTVLFRSSGVIRPLGIVVLFGTMAAAGHRVSRLVVMLLVLAVLPLQAYRDAWTRIAVDEHPMRSASECLARLESRMPAAPGLYVDVPGEYISHPLYYYFRRVRPWTSAKESDPAAMARYLDDPAEQRPMLVWDKTYRTFMNARATVESGPPASPPLVAFPDVVLLLPGRYAACNVEVSRLPQR